MSEPKPELKIQQDPFAVNFRNDLAKKFGFGYICCFDEGGLAIAMKGEHKEIKFLINKKGETIAGPYHHVQPFKEGLARIRKDDTGYYFIDREGKELIGPFKGLVGDFKDGFSYIRDGTDMYFINKNGERVQRKVEKKSEEKPPKEKTWPTVERRNGGFYLINEEGKEIAGPFARINSFKEDLALVNIEKEGEPYGENYYIDKEGKIKLGPYDAHEGFDFNEGVAVVCTDQRIPYYIDHNGKKVFEK